MGIGVLVIAFTVLSQIGMQIFVDKAGLVVSEDVAIGLGGSLGIALTGICVAFRMKKKGYCDFEAESEVFDCKKALFYGILAISICHVLFSAVTTVFLAGIVPNVVADGTRPEGTLLTLVTTVVIAPVTEELLFRAGIYSYIKVKFGNKSALVISSLIFAVLHLYIPIDFLSCVLAGVVFAIIYDKTGTIWYSIIAHVLCNLEAFLVNILESQGVFLQYEVNGYSMYHVVITIPVLMFLGWVVWRNNAWNRIDSKEGR